MKVLHNEVKTSKYNYLKMRSDLPSTENGHSMPLFQELHNNETVESVSKESLFNLETTTSVSEQELLTLDTVTFESTSEGELLNLETTSVLPAEENSSLNGENETL